MQLSLADRTYLVTGGGSGIGKGVAAALVTAGARVMIVGRNPDRLAAAVSDIRGNAGDSGGAVRYEPTDITNEDETARAVDAATDPNQTIVISAGAFLLNSIDRLLQRLPSAFVRMPVRQNVIVIVVAMVANTLIVELHWRGGDRCSDSAGGFLRRR